jgi:hypothetical protein
MAKYFCIQTGLRGCYMPDQSYHVKVTSRKALKSVITDECNLMREAYGFGGPAKEISSTIAHIWREANSGRNKSYLPYAIGFGRSRDTHDRPFAVFIAHADRRDYEEEVNNMD